MLANFPSAKCRAGLPDRIPPPSTCESSPLDMAHLPRCYLPLEEGIQGEGGGFESDSVKEAGEIL